MKKFKTITLTTLLILGLIILLNFLNLGFLFSFHSFINDKAYSLREKSAADTNIVLVNLGNLPRSEVATLINRIAAGKPKVIGIHACFDGTKKTTGDSALKASLASTPNLVILGEENCQLAAGMKYSKLSLLMDEDDVFRSFKIENAENFESRIVKLYDEKKYQNLVKHSDKPEQINYRGNTDHFFAADFDQVLQPDFDAGFIKDKIVLIGFLGNTLSSDVKSLESAVYTPMNDHLNEQKPLPDMYKVVVSANVISTIINNGFIEEVPAFVSILITLCIIIFNLLIASVLIDNFSNFFLFIITAFVTEVFLAGLLIVWLLNDFNKMLYLKELPVAIIISFIVYFSIYIRLSIKSDQKLHSTETKKELI
jgi:CHASE2 domain-containing sensor protein